MRILLMLTLMVALALPFPARGESTAPAMHSLPAAAAALPLLHQHRVKPFAVAADEIALAITGYSRKAEVAVDTTGRSVPPIALVMGLMLAPASWRDRPLLYVPYLPLQQKLGLKTQWASLAEIDAQRPYLMSVAGRKQRADATGEKLALDRIDREALTLGERAVEAMETLEGRALGLAPLAPTPADRTWALTTLAAALSASAPEDSGGEHLWRARLREILAVAEKDRDTALARADIWLAMEDVITPDPLLAQVPDARLAAVLAAGTAWVEAVRSSHADDGVTRAFAAALMHADHDAATYPTSTKIAAELAYTRARPFTWTWMCYIAGGILAAIGLGRARPLADGGRGSSRWFTLGVVITAIGVACNLAGLGVRVYITSLGAVTNLYETLVYVALLCAVLGLVFARLSGNGIYAVAGGIAGGMCAMVGETIPPDLGSHIGQLQPVLRSKFWLWTHVKTVVASYAAFLLAWAMGNIVLARAVIGRRAVRADEARTIYRCVQVGVVLIAAGTLLGAVWADQAWGRFWGWDPKEVGALIVLLAYLVPLHLRFAGTIQANGFAACSVICILSVVWSWYGVNFIQGSGLHAYAFGNGGQGWVIGACLVQSVWVAVAAILLHRFGDAAAEPRPATAAAAPVASESGPAKLTGP